MGEFLGQLQFRLEGSQIVYYCGEQCLRNIRAVRSVVDGNQTEFVFVQNEDGALYYFASGGGRMDRQVQDMQARGALFTVVKDDQGAILLLVSLGRQLYTIRQRRYRSDQFEMPVVVYEAMEDITRIETYVHHGCLYVLLEEANSGLVLGEYQKEFCWKSLPRSAKGDVAHFVSKGEELFIKNYESANTNANTNTNTKFYCVSDLVSDVIGAKNSPNDNGWYDGLHSLRAQRVPASFHRVVMQEANQIDYDGEEETSKNTNYHKLGKSKKINPFVSHYYQCPSDKWPFEGFGLICEQEGIHALFGGYVDGCWHVLSGIRDVATYHAVFYQDKVHVLLVDKVGVVYHLIIDENNTTQSVLMEFGLVKAIDLRVSEEGLKGYCVDRLHDLVHVFTMICPDEGWNILPMILYYRKKYIIRFNQMNDVMGEGTRKLPVSTPSYVLPGKQHLWDNHEIGVC